MEENPVNSLILLYVAYFLLAGLGTVLMIFVYGYAALAIKFIIDWIKRGQEIARERRGPAPE